MYDAPRWNLSILIENKKSYAICETEFKKILAKTSMNTKKKIHGIHKKTRVKPIWYMTDDRV